MKPTTQKRAVAVRRRPKSEFRSREHLTETEVEKLIEAAKNNRYGRRDATMILTTGMAYGRPRFATCDGSKSISTPPLPPDFFMTASDFMGYCDAASRGGGALNSALKAIFDLRNVRFC